MKSGHFAGNDCTAFSGHLNQLARTGMLMEKLDGRGLVQSGKISLLVHRRQPRAAAECQR